MFVSKLMFRSQLKIEDSVKPENSGSVTSESAPKAVACEAAAEIDVELSDSDTEQKQQEVLMSHITDEYDMPADWESNGGQCRLKHHICQSNIVPIRAVLWGQEITNLFQITFVNTVAMFPSVYFYANVGISH